MPSFENEPGPDNVPNEDNFDVKFPEILGGGSLYETLMYNARGELKHAQDTGSASSWWDPKAKQWTKDGYETMQSRYGMYKGFDRVMERVARELAKEDLEQK